MCSARLCTLRACQIDSRGRRRELLPRLKDTNNKLVVESELTSLGGVRVPSTSNRHRMFRSREKPFIFSIPALLLLLDPQTHSRFTDICYQLEVRFCAKIKFTWGNKKML